jgi:regulator of protease activity HflC (stomatin/prohibitin superfamily)
MKPIREWAAIQGTRARRFCRRQAPYLILISFLLLFVMVFFFNSIVILIHPGELGVLWKLLGGGTQIDTVYREGMHVILPWNKMYVYNVRKQQFTDSINVLTVDGLTVGVKYSVRYYLEKDTLPLLHQRVGPDYVNVVVKPEIRSVIRTIFGQYKPEEIYTNQKAIQERISELSKGRLGGRFVSLDDVPIESVTLPPKISDAIEAKLTQQQLDEEYTFRIDVATKEAERKRIESAGIRDYNNTVNGSLNPSILAFQGILATQELSKSPNSKVIVIGAGKSGLPLILGNQ